MTTATLERPLVSERIGSKEDIQFLLKRSWAPLMRQLKGMSF